ncbi:dolichyl phosphate glucosyltransferase [Chytridium lagenaria]|nr:dolichyl phosphate glucosyltransferase [Chytridium lagenaria]
MEQLIIGLITTAILLALSTIAFLSLTAPTPRKPTDNELHYTDVLTKDRKKFPSLRHDPSVALSVVIPAYNESKRLPKMMEEAFGFLEERRKRDVKETYEIVVVDDGRGIGEVRVLTLEKNRGKGGAVAQGVLVSRGERILFVDADGSTKFSDLEKLEAALHKVSKGTGLGVAVGSRAHMVKSEAVVKRSAIRNFLMHSFHTLLLILGISSIKDTQCGFKLFTRGAAVKIFSNVNVEGWIFDIEVLLLASWQKIPIVEVAVTWEEMEGSKMSLLRDSVKMALDLLVIRVNYLVGVWRVREVGEKKVS